MIKLAIVVCAVLAPVSPLAAPAEATRYVYARSSVFAYPGESCPNGSEPVSDPVYQQAAKLSRAAYCIFPSRDIDVAAGSDCPAGFERSSATRCHDKRGR